MNKSEHFNQLSPAEAERLACLAEECGEVIQAIGKVLRHGYEDYSPFDETCTTNRQNLEREIGDLSAVIDTMRFANDVSDIRIHLAANEKLAKLPRWTHHQPNSEGMPPSPQTNVLAFPRELTDDLRNILSMMMWTTGPIAHALRAGGADIKTRAEDEQAYVMHWMITLALEHGPEWPRKVSDRISEIRATLATTEGQEG